MVCRYKIIPFKCSCKNVEIGSFDRHISLTPPIWSSKKVISVDVCLKEEILYLWEQGVITGGCCCGHQIHKPTIGVYKESIAIMKILGYEVANEFYPELDLFYYAKGYAVRI